MMKKAQTPYPECTEDDIVLVCEPAAKYGEPIVYQGTTITNALKDYYAFTTNHEKVDVLKWIVAQSNFVEMQRFSTTENKIFTLYENQYNEILKTGEIPNNLQIAQKFVMNGYDVFLLSNPKGTKSADFIIRKRNCLYYVEGKTSSGGSSLVHRFEKAAGQADRIAVNFTQIPSFHDIYTQVKKGFEHNQNVKDFFIFKGSRLILISKKMAESKRFDINFKSLWNSNK